MKFRLLSLAVILLAAGAAPAAPTLPLRYRLMINSPAPTLSAGTAFLRDDAAQQWFLDNRPAQFPALLRDALGLRDWERVLTSYDDPRQLREAILSRQDSDIATQPALLLALVDRTPALAAKRRLYEEAVLDWSVFSPGTRGVLNAADISNKLWSDLNLSDRYRSLRRISQKVMGTLITVGPGHPEYTAQYAKALSRTSAIMTDEEIKKHHESITRAKRLDKGLRLAAKAAGASADETAAALVDSARRAEDLDAVEAALGLACSRLGLAVPAEKPEPAYDLSPEETGALLARLSPAILDVISGTPSGDELLAAISDTGLRLTIDETAHDGVLAHYTKKSKVIVFGDKQLARLMAELGRVPRDLLSNDEALADAAVLYASLFVHEATHHR